MELFCFINMKRILFFVLLQLCLIQIVVSQPVRIAVVSDIHYLSSKLVGDGDAYRRYVSQTGRDIGDLHAVLDYVIDEISSYGPDILLIPGDLTNHGEADSHKELLVKLKPLREQGVRVLVVPGNHDVAVPDSRSYVQNKLQPAANISALEFSSLYSDFGYGDALKRDDASLSYLTEIDPNTWLLCLDTNRHSEYVTTSLSSGRILPETLAWALEILADAKQKGVKVLGMMHHGLVEHMPYQSAFFANYLVDEWRHHADILADAGLQVVFTGHFHANDVTLFTSGNGSKLYDVETGSLAQYPFPYRLMELDGSNLTINSFFVDSLPGIPQLGNKYRTKLEEISERVIKSRINNMNMPMPVQLKENLTQLLVQMSLHHVAGDEKPDSSMLRLIDNLALIMGDEDFDMDSFSLDFPPSDNNLTIVLE